MARLIFDLDGTLVDSVATMAAAANAFLAERGLPPVPLGTVRGFVGHGIRRLVAPLLANAGAEPDDIAADLAIYRRHYEADPLTGTEPYPGVAEALAALAAAGHGLAVCTQKPDAPARAILERLGLMPPITGFAGGDSLPGVLKPDRRLFDHAAGQLAPGPAILIGDSETDAEAARIAGAPFLLRLGGYTRAAPESLAAAGVFADYAELPALVEATLGR